MVIHTHTRTISCLEPCVWLFRFWMKFEPPLLHSIHFVLCLFFFVFFLETKKNKRSGFMVFLGCVCLVVILVIIGSNIVAYDSGARPSEYIHVDRYANNNLIISLTTQVFHISFFFFVSSHFVWGLFFFFCHDRLSSLLCRFHYRVFIITRVHYVVKKSVAGLFFFSQPHLPSFLFRVSSLISWEISSSLPTLSRFHVVVVLFVFFLILVLVRPTRKTTERKWINRTTCDHYKTSSCP